PATGRTRARSSSPRPACRGRYRERVSRACPSDSLPPDGPFDQSIRLIGRDENIVLKLQSKRLEIERNAVQVGKRERDRIDRRTRRQGGLAHVDDGLLHTEAVPRGEGFKDGT